MQSSCGKAWEELMVCCSFKEPAQNTEVPWSSCVLWTSSKRSKSKLVAPGARVRPSTNNWGFLPTKLLGILPTTNQLLGILPIKLLGLLPTNYWLGILPPNYNQTTSKLTKVSLSAGSNGVASPYQKGSNRQWKRVLKSKTVARLEQSDAWVHPGNQEKDRIYYQFSPPWQSFNESGSSIIFLLSFFQPPLGNPCF